MASNRPTRVAEVRSREIYLCDDVFLLSRFSTADLGQARNMADLNLTEIHDTLVELAFAAGKMILAANPQDLDTDTKLNCKRWRQLSRASVKPQTAAATYLSLYIPSRVIS